MMSSIFSNTLLIWLHLSSLVCSSREETFFNIFLKRKDSASRSEKPPSEILLARFANHQGCTGMVLIVEYFSNRPYKVTLISVKLIFCSHVSSNRIFEEDLWINRMKVLGGNPVKFLSLKS